MVVYHGGFTTYGQPIGILMVDTRFPRIKGDIGNASTFPFPVVYRVVRGADARRVVLEPDPAIIGPFVAAAKELEEAGVRAITTSCGFLALFQREIGESLRVPFFSSALLMVPLVSRMVGGRPVGILTARQKSLSERHFNSVGWSSSDVDVVVHGLDEAPVFARSIFGDSVTIDYDRYGEEVVEASRQMLEARPDVAAIVLECTNLPPFTAAIQRAVDRPVFSIIDLVKMMYSGLEHCSSSVH